MKKLHTNKGFTLAELLIVVAVIAVLVAIAIPTFSDQLEKARESTDVSNIREAYSEIAVALSDGTLTNADDTITLLGGKTATLTITAAVAANPDADPPVTASPAKKEVAIESFAFTQQVFSPTVWASGIPNIGGVALTGLTANTDTTLTFTFEEEAGGTTGSSHYYLSTVAFSAP